MGKNRTLRYLDPACGSLGAQPAAKSPVLPGQSGVSFCKHKFAWAVWQMRTCRSETPPFCLRKNVLSLKHPAGVFVASANANLSGRSPSILLTQDRSVACTPHWGFHCFTSFRKRELVGAQPRHLAIARPFCRLHTPLGCALLNIIQQTRIFKLVFANNL